MDLEFVLRAMPVMSLRYFDEIWGNFRFYPGTITAERAARGEDVVNVMATLKTFHASLPFKERVYVVPLFALASSRAFGLWVWFTRRLGFTIRHPMKALRRARDIVTGRGRPMLRSLR
jgi:hypothetical protein